MTEKILYCSVELERKVASLYEELASLAESEDRFISLILKQIGLESMVHSEVLRSLGMKLGLYEETEDCRSLLGEAWTRIEEAYSEIRRSEKPDIRSILKEILSVEGFVGEETYHKLLMPLLKKLLKDEDSQKLARLALEKIIEDEAFHENAVNQVVGY
ncbi:hypothetical protein [Thermosphaera sp.]